MDRRPRRGRPACRPSSRRRSPRARGRRASAAGCFAPRAGGTPLRRAPERTTETSGRCEVVPMSRRDDSLRRCRRRRRRSISSWRRSIGRPSSTGCSGRSTIRATPASGCSSSTRTPTTGSSPSSRRIPDSTCCTSGRPRPVARSERRAAASRRRHRRLARRRLLLSGRPARAGGAGLRRPCRGRRLGAGGRSVRPADGALGPGARGDHARHGLESGDVPHALPAPRRDRG